MPEGPECRRYAMDLAERVSSRILLSVEMVSGRYTKKPPTGIDSFTSHLPCKIVGAGVHGKFIYWILSDELSIWSTLGMTGAWSSQESKHTRVKFHLNDGTVYYNDQRNFGTLKFVRGKFQLIEKLKSMGPDMLASDVSDEDFIGKIKKKPDWQITKALMDQSIISGVGNYVKSDSLWLARISPLRKVSELSDDDFRNLNRSIKQIMRESFQTGGATIQTYKPFDGSEDDSSRKFLVYNQGKDPDGNNVVKQMTDDKRSTFWVPDTQV
jgi:formamidopyrimidine-DNA glycosylase